MSVSSRMCPQDNDIVTVKTTSGNTQITVGALRTLINVAGYNTAILINNYGGSEYALIWFQTVAEDLYLADDQTFLGESRNYPIFGIKPNGSYGVHVDTTYRLKNDLSGFESFQDVNWSIGRSKEVDGVYYDIIDDNARSTESFPAMCVSTYDGNIYCNGEPYVPPVQTHTSNGGGATHIAKVTGQLKDLSSNLSDILIVSGGGGGGMLIGDTAYPGADAGGISGSGDNSADQTTGNAFGQGESGTNVSGGGGGLYGGYKGIVV